MRVLVITRSAWDDSNSTGNTMTNLFSNFEELQVANLYYRKAQPNNSVCNRYFSISDYDIIKNLINKKHNVGSEFFGKHTTPFEEIKKEDKIYTKYRRKNSSILLLLQNLLWDIGRWKNNNFRRFLDDFKPDIIFSPSYHTVFSHKVLNWLVDYTGAKLVLYHSDDYILKRLRSINPIKYLLTFKQKRWINNSIKISDLNYCIQDNQIEEYRKIYPNKTFKLLQKGSIYKSYTDISIVKDRQKILNIVYTGALSYGRINILIDLIDRVKKTNKLIGMIKISIYSQYKPSNKELKKLNVNNISCFKGKVNPEELEKIYSNADLLLFLESFERKNIEQTRYSFSTKIIDYLSTNKPIIAIGPNESGSIRYLNKNKVAKVIDNPNNLIPEIKNYIFNIKDQELFLNNAKTLLLTNHDILKIRSRMYDDFLEITKN